VKYVKNSKERLKNSQQHVKNKDEFPSKSGTFPYANTITCLLSGLQEN
jgi:hypothetical protein